MEYPDWRKEAVDETRELFPVDEGPLAAPPKRAEPVPTSLGKEPPQARIISRHGVVVQVPYEHPLQPCPGVRDGVVQSPAQFHLDCL